MSPSSKDASRAMLESLCVRFRIAVVLVDEGGRVAWTSRFTQDEFPGVFLQGRSFEVALEQCTRKECERVDFEILERGPSSGELRRATSGTPAVYRCFRLPFEEAAPGCALHYLINIHEEKKLEERFLHSLQQLKSMREIVDILYESLGTQEVIYLILVAVTSQIGFGFNRAFFLQVKGNRLRGRIGIGPSNHEEAHQIWSRLATLNFSSLREVYNDLTRNGDVPDPHTQEIALRLDFDLSRVIADNARAAEPKAHDAKAPEAKAFDAKAGEPRVEAAPGLPAPAEPVPGLLGALACGKPARLHSGDAGTEVDRALFRLLSTDAVAVVPLFVRGKLAGVIIADNFINRRLIVEADLNLLKTFAGYAGVALERSHLYDELRESIAKLQEANDSLKANQQRLLQAEKLSAIGELAAYVSHEIRNPLVAIGGLARSLLKDQIDNPDTAETLQIIVSEVHRLEKFLRETLDFVKPRLSRSVSVNLNDLVPDCVATFRNELAKHSIDVQLDLAGAALRCVIDPDLLRHAISNLIKNAIEALNHGGKLYLGTRKDGTSAVVRVGDTGPGIPPEMKGRIFEPFFTTKSEGTGLGLTISSQNIKNLGGRLELDADPVLRTVFKLTLPLEEVTHKGNGRMELVGSMSGR